MKRLILLVGILLPILGSSQTGNIDFYMDICRFQDFRVGKPIVELYFAVDGKSITHKIDKDGLFQAQVNIAWKLNQLVDSDTVPVFADNFNLMWAPDLRLQDTTAEAKNKALFHFQKIDLDPGNYLLEAIAIDRNAGFKSRSKAISVFEVQALAPGEFGFSDVKWISQEKPQQKGRISTRDDLIPLVTNDAFINEDSMVFFIEAYNVDKIMDKTFAFRARILLNDNIIWDYDFTRRKAATYFNAFKGKFYIPKLKSNTYYLQIELLNNRNKPIKTYRKKFFVYNSRVETEFDNIITQNPESDIFNQYSDEQLDYYLASLTYISTQQERNFAKILNNRTQKKNYLFSFFEKRKKAPDQKVQALWNGHLAALDYVNQQFSALNMEGWETDRGRVFLQYGIPNDVERFPAEPNMIPYEVWQYNRLGRQTNIQFVFFDPDLSSNEYPLLHSNKYGEIRNPRWRLQLANQGHVPGDIDFEQFDNDPAGRQYDSKLRIRN